MNLTRCAAVVLPFLLAACGNDDGSPKGPGNGAAVEFFDLRVENISTNRAVVRFRTSVPTTCEVEYGPNITLLDLRATDPSMLGAELALEHEVPLEDLAEATTYYYRGYVVDQDGAAYRSEKLSFTTLTDMGPSLANYAFAGTVTDVSSNFGGGANDSTWGADNAIDGLMSTEWASDGDGDAAYIVIDLGQARTLSHLGFRSRKMADGSSIIRSVEFTVDGGTALGPYSTPDPDVGYLFELAAPITGQVVRLDAVTTSGGNAGVKEIELLGAP